MPRTQAGGERPIAMWGQLKSWLKAFAHQLARVLGAVLVLAGRGVRAGWALVRPTLVFALNVLLALLLLFEEWGWRPLSNLLA